MGTIVPFPKRNTPPPHESTPLPQQARVVEFQEIPQQTDEDDEEQDNSAQNLSQNALRRQLSLTWKKLEKARERLKYWEEEARAHEQKRDMCKVLLAPAIANDAVTAGINVVSFGLLGIITAPVPGILRAIVATTEREQKPERLLRVILVMMLKAIPAINTLPATTFLMIVDLVEASTDLEMAKNKKESKEKEIKQLAREFNQIAKYIRIRLRNFNATPARHSRAA